MRGSTEAWLIHLLGKIPSAMTSRIVLLSLGLAATSMCYSSPGVGSNADVKHPALSQVRIPPDSSDQLSLDESRLKSGLFVLVDRSGVPKLEVPMTLADKSKVLQVIDSNSHIHLLVGNRQGLAFISIRRPPYSVDLNFVPGNKGTFEIRSITMELSRLPDFFDPAVSANILSLCSAIDKKLADGDYLSADDARPDLEEVNRLFSAALNIGVVRTKSLVPFRPLQADRPLVHIRDWRRLASSDSPHASASRMLWNAEAIANRLLNSGYGNSFGVGLSMPAWSANFNDLGFSSNLPGPPYYGLPFVRIPEFRTLFAVSCHIVYDHSNYFQHLYHEAITVDFAFSNFKTRIDPDGSLLYSHDGAKWAQQSASDIPWTKVVTPLNPPMAPQSNASANSASGSKFEWAPSIEQALR